MLAWYAQRQVSKTSSSRSSRAAVENRQRGPISWVAAKRNREGAHWRVFPRAVRLGRDTRTSKCCRSTPPTIPHVSSENSSTLPIQLRDFSS